MLVEQQYQHYLQITGLDEKTMHTEQKVETKRAFYAGFGNAIVWLMDNSRDSPVELFESDIESVKNELTQFWQSQK